MYKKDVILWLGLIALTLTSYFSAESSIEEPTLLFLLLGITAVKFIGVGFQFMELKKAHVFWKICFVIIFSVFSILVITL